MLIYLPALLLTLTLTPQELSGETETRSVGLGETLTLLCDVAHEEQTLWFGQRSDEAPFLSIQASTKRYDTNALFSQFILGASVRLAVGFDAAAASVLLKIENVTESDSALYYCASMRRGGLFFGNGTKIIISGDSHDGPPSLVSPDCVLCCVHLAFVSLVCAVVCTAALCFCICQELGTACTTTWNVPKKKRNLLRTEKHTVNRSPKENDSHLLQTHSVRRMPRPQ